MAITYNVVDIRGVAAEPVVEELIFENKTISDNLVTFQEDVKAETVFTETSTNVTMQTYTSGAPTSAGSLIAFDVPVTPVKFLYYQEFDPNSLRFSRFKRDMKPGAWEIMSTEFEKLVIGGEYAKKISYDVESKFWNNITSATKTAIAGLTPGSGQTQVSTQEQALAAATTTGLFDGVVVRMIYNNSNATLTAGVGGRVKVVGTTVTSSNIKGEYDKVYAAIPAVDLDNTDVAVRMYVPKSHKQMINIYNNTPTNYTKPFVIEGGKYYFNDVEIAFVPLPENVIIAAKPSYINWCTDLLADINRMQLDKIQNNSDQMFIKNVMTIFAHVTNQAYNVLYVG